MAYETHKHAAESITARCAIITLSDTRTEQTDKTGQLIRQLLIDNGHTVADYKLIPDDPTQLEKLLSNFLGDSSIDVILTTGGTGISRRDQTISVIEKSLTQTLNGFGELFRMRSCEQVGAAAMLSRATAGITRGKPIFAMPGSSKAVELAMSELILPQLRHILYELRK